MSFPSPEPSRLTPVATNSRLSRAFCTQNNQVVKASVDTLAIVGEPAPALFHFLNEHSEDDYEVIRNGVSSSHGWQCSGYGHFKQYSSMGGLIRFEFPVHNDEYDWESILDTGLLVPSRFNRIDIAIDYPFSLADFTFDMPNIGRSQWSENGETTRYFGSKQSEKRFRIYDKAEPKVGRIEVQLKRRRASSELPEEIFDSVIAHSGFDRSGLSHGPLCHLIAELQEPGLARQFGSRYARDIEAALAQCGHPLSPSPAEVYRLARASLSEELRAMLTALDGGLSR